MFETPLPSSARRRLFVALTLGMVLGGGFLVAEIAVRALFRYNSPDTLRRNSLRYVPSTFTRHLLASNQEIDVDEAWGLKDPAQRIGLTYTVNERGYRGRPFAAARPAAGCRVAILGGSAVFDRGADRGADWPHLVEQRLRESGHDSVEVINGGVPGHASSDAVGKLYAQLWLYEPDFVLLYNAWNDIKTFTELSRERPLASLLQPYDPNADPYQNYQGFLDRQFARSQVYVKLRTRYLLWKYDRGPEGQLRSGMELADRWNPLGLAQYRLNVELVVDGTRNIDATPVLLTQASLLAVHNTEEDRERIAYGYQGLSHDALVRAMAACNDTVRAVGRAKGVEVLDLAARFEGRSELFDDHVHTSRAGSTALANAVTEFLAPRLDATCNRAVAASTADGDQVNPSGRDAGGQRVRRDD